MKKKILSIVMAAAMVLSVSSVSQAAATEVTITPVPSSSPAKYAAPEIVANGAYEAPTIKVSIDTAAKSVIINPYGLAKSSNGVSDTAEQKEQLVSKLDSIENKSEVALAVNATVKATKVDGTGASVKLATTAVNPTTEKSNSIFAYLNVKAEAAAPTASTTMKLTENAYDSKASNQVVFSEKETTKKGLVTLSAPGGATPFAYYKILGTVAANPTIPWTVDDKIDFSIVFDFEPRIESGS